MNSINHIARRLLNTSLFAFLFIPVFLTAQKANDCELIKAVKQNDRTLTDTLIKQGADVNCTDENGATALMWAAYKGSFVLFQQLIKAGADYHKQGVIYTDTTGNYYGNITGIAAGKNDTVLLFYCLDVLKINPNDAEYDPQTKQNDGWMPLHWAAYNGSDAAIRSLITYKAAVNAVYSKDGFSPLMYAARSGNLNSVLILLECGAQTKLKSKEAKTAYNYAYENKQYRTALSILRWQMGSRPEQIKQLKDSLAAAEKLYEAGELAEQRKEYNLALENFLKELEYCRLIFGDKHPEYALSLNNLSLLYTKLEQYEKALQLNQHALQIWRDAVGERHPYYVTSLKNLAGLYYQAKEYEKAISFYEKAAQIDKEVSGEKNVDYANSLYNIAAIYDKINQREKALALYRQVLQIRKEVLGETHPDYVILFQALQITEGREGAGNSEYANSLYALAAMYYNSGQYAKALQLHQQSLKIRKSILSEKHPDYLNSLGSIAALYNAMGQYDKALPLYLQVLQIRKETLGEKHPDFIKSLNNIAGLYCVIGQPEKALPLYQQVLRVGKEVWGEKHRYYIASLNNLALLYHEMGQNEKAMPLYQQALQIMKDEFGEKDRLYVFSLNNLALVYQEMGQNEKAIALLQQALKIWKEVWGEKHPDYAGTLNNLASLFEKMKQFDKALPMYEQELQIRKQLSGEQYPAYSSSLLAFSFCRLKMNFPDQSVMPDFIKAYSGLLQQLRSGSRFLSSTALQQFIQKDYRFIEMLHSLSAVLQHQQLISTGYQAALELKGIALQNNKDLLSVLNQNTSKEYEGTINQYFAVKARLNNSFQSSSTNKQELDSLTNQFENLEQELMQKLPGFQQLVQGRNISWKQVQEKLKPGEAAIEFVEFNYWNKRWTDTSLYAAYVLFAKGEPQFITLCSKKQLEQKITEAQQKDQSYVKKLNERKLRGSEATDESTTVPQPDLYELVWKKLDSMLINISTVYYAPAGLLHRVNPAAVEYLPKKVLAEKYSFHLLASTRDIANYQPQQFNTGTDSVLFYGGIEYNMDSSFAISQRRKFLPNEEMMDKIVLRGEETTFSWPALSGTEKEVNALETIVKQKKIGYSYYKGKEASEESFLYHTVSKPPAFIHIATHGFFYTDEVRKHVKEEEKQVPYFLSSPNAMYRSGLVFAGANRVSMGKEPVKGIEDGIVTAGDFAGMNLQGTRLIVLSACETGLGKIDNTEGVFGLQRGIRLAGCKNLLMSLWKVPDEPTAKFMELFYNKLLLDKKSVYESYQYAQQQMRKLYADDPFVWAAFVLME